MSLLLHCSLIPTTLSCILPLSCHPRQSNRFALRKAMALGKRTGNDPAELGQDYSSKLLHLAWHPEANVIACAAANSLYMYCA